MVGAGAVIFVDTRITEKVPLYLKSDDEGAEWPSGKYVLLANGNKI